VLGANRTGRRGDHEPELITKQTHLISPGLLGIFWAASTLAGVACDKNNDIAAVAYTCGTSGVSSDPALIGAGVMADCGDIDAQLPPEPSLPTTPTDPACIITANQITTETSWIPAETNVMADTLALNNALAACKVVKVQSDGTNNSLVVAHINLTGATLWIDGGVTLFASRDPSLYQSTGNCGVLGVNDSAACNDFITVNGASPAIVGDGIIDGQGGEPLVGHDYSWWQMSDALQNIDGSIGNPTLINLKTGVTGFLLYKITLHNSPKFHVKITSTPAGGAFAADGTDNCTAAGVGFTVWGITILTPSRWLNSQGLLMSPHFSRNTDGVDPGETSVATCGVIAHNTISTGDDHIALKGGHWVSGVLIAHNHFGTGHGMSIGSETYGAFTTLDGKVHYGVENVTVCDLTIDADSRPVGQGASSGDFNGIRVKSDSSRGGMVNNINFRNICMRDVNNAILMSTAYNPLFAGTMYPMFKTMLFQNIHDVTCMNVIAPVVTLNGFSPALPAGPITLDNVVVDNIGPAAVESAFANLVLGPGNVNFAGFIPTANDATVSNKITDDTSPTGCDFPALPAPQPPPGWLR
jgi:polygalacturonase